MQALPFETATQWAGLLVALIAGWVIGLATHPGGRKWRTRFREAEAEQRDYRQRTEAELQERAERIRVLEEENARLRADTTRVVDRTTVVPADTASEAELRAREVEAARRDARDAEAIRHGDLPPSADPHASDRALPAGYPRPEDRLR